MSARTISRDRERERASQCEHDTENRRRDERRRDAIGQIGRERPGEDQQRIGQAKRDCQHAGGGAAEDVVEGGSKIRAGMNG